jgi:hypothetical protein
MSFVHLLVVTFKFYANPRNWVRDKKPLCKFAPSQEVMDDIICKGYLESNDRVTQAPWTDDQVLSLNTYQECSRYHPLTYSNGDEKVNLIATNEGWVACQGGPVVQAWAHRWMADWSWDLKPCLPI